MVETIPAMGRIMNTPMPFAYVVHLRSFMVRACMGCSCTLRQEHQEYREEYMAIPSVPGHA